MDEKDVQGSFSLFQACFRLRALERRDRSWVYLYEFAKVSRKYVRPDKIRSRERNVTSSLYHPTVHRNTVIQKLIFIKQKVPQIG